MTDPKQIPLVSPPKRRSWRQVIWLRPLVSSPQSAMVATRRGRLVSVLPAGRMLRLPDVAHFPHFEAPGEVLPALVEHLA